LIVGSASGTAQVTLPEVDSPRPALPTEAAVRNCLLVGVRGHGGEDVYSNLLRDNAPEGFSCSSTFDFHSSCDLGRCRTLQEIALNRLIHPLVPFDMGFRVLEVARDADLVHVHSHPTVLRGLGARPVVFSAGSSHYHYVRYYEGWSDGQIEAAYARARKLYRRLGVLDALLNHEQITLTYTFSRWARERYLQEGVPEWKIRVLPPGFDIPEPPDRAIGSTVTFLFLGRQPKRKGGAAVLEAYARLRVSHPDTRLLYVSDELPASRMEGVEPRPLVPSGFVRDLYRAADVFVNPTRAEGFGFTNVEAQGHGLPVISSRLGAIPEVVEDGRTGILIDAQRPHELVSAMERFASDDGMRRAMAAAARRRFVGRFSLSVFRSALRDLYEEAADRARASGAP
jgi:glycosyltransferase involved in cell wall biosynthesis